MAKIKGGQKYGDVLTLLNQGYWSNPFPIADEISRIGGRTFKSGSIYHPNTSHTKRVKRALDKPHELTFAYMDLAFDGWCEELAILRGNSVDRIVTVGEVAHTISRRFALFGSTTPVLVANAEFADYNSMLDQFPRYDTEQWRSYYRDALERLRNILRRTNDKHAALSWLAFIGEATKSAGEQSVMDTAMTAIENGLSFDEYRMLYERGITDVYVMAEFKKNDIDFTLIDTLIEA